MANAAYASLIAIAASAVLVFAAAADGGPASQVVAPIGAALLVHLALTLVMVLRRVFFMAIDHLDAVRTGAARLELTAIKGSVE